MACLPLVRDVAVLHKTFKCDYTEGLSWWQQSILRQAVYLKLMLWKILAQNVTFAYWNTICKSCFIQRLNLFSLFSEIILHIDILIRNLHLFIAQSSAEVLFYFLPMQREDFLIFCKTNSMTVTQEGFQFVLVCWALEIFANSCRSADLVLRLSLGLGEGACIFGRLLGRLSSVVVLAVVQTAVPKGWWRVLLLLQCESFADILNMSLFIATQFWLANWFSFSQIGKMNFATFMWPWCLTEVTLPARSAKKREKTEAR